MNRMCKIAMLTVLVMLSAKLSSHSQEQPKQQTPASIEAGKKEPQTPLKVGGRISAPRIITAPQPEYSESARSRGYEGICVLWLIVGVDGEPHDIRIARSLGLGLDEKAIEAVQQWRFEPAKMDGKPVAVQINVEVNFHLYDDGGPSQKLIAKANAGDARAQLELGMLYIEGRKVSKNERYGKDLLQRAADQGLAKAQFALAERVYRHSPENFTDYVTAYMWYTLARRAGEKKAEMPLRDLTSKMSTEQLSQAEARVANWKPTSMK